MTTAPIERPAAHHSGAMAALLILVFWMIAAGLVSAAHAFMDPMSSNAAATSSMVTLIVVSWIYSRVVARDAGITHALTVGISWLFMSVTAELVIATRIGHGWFSLLGSPDRPIVRNVMLFIWVLAPALFARREVNG